MKANLTHQIDDAKIACNTYTDTAIRPVADRVTTNENAITAINDSLNEVKNSVKQSEIDVETETADSPVNLTKTVSEGKNIIGVRLKISPSENNLIVTEDGTLFASKDARYHSCLGENGAASNVQGELNKLFEGVREAKSIAEDVHTLQTAVTMLQGAIQTNNGKIENLTSTVNSFDARINNAETLMPFPPGRINSELVRLVSPS